MIPDQMHLDAAHLLERMRKTQWETRNYKALIPNTPILTREKLQQIAIDKNMPYTYTSGSSGKPVFVQKYWEQGVWHHATNTRELLWRNWNTELNIAVIAARVIENITPIDANPYVFKTKNFGNVYYHNQEGDLQKWIDSVPISYLHSYPSIISTLDTSKLIDVKSTGEPGGTNYSSQELGTIGLTCPDNPDVYHIMENIIVEIDKDNNLIITDLTHPYIKRYLIGDKGEFTTCSCGRGLQTIKKNVLGRTWNYITHPDGHKHFVFQPATKMRRIVDTIKRAQLVQTSITDITARIQGIIPDEKIPEIIELINVTLGGNFNITFEYVNEFPEGKFNDFISTIV